MPWYVSNFILGHVFGNKILKVHGLTLRLFDLTITPCALSDVVSFSINSFQLSCEFFKYI